MKRRWMALFLVAMLVSIYIAPTAYAILGLGDIVFDPSNFAEAVEQVVRLEEQYVQLVQTYQMIRNQYDHAKWMAQRVPVDMSRRYLTPATLWNNSSASNAYGSTAGWVDGINNGLAVSDGYWNAVQPLDRYGDALGNIPADQLPRVKTNYATVELADGANLSAIETIGRLRANAPAVESTIQNLEDDSLSSDPNMNTEIAVLNKINAANLISIRSSQDTNKLLVALAEEQLIDAKRKRDAEAEAIHNHIRFVADGRAVMAAQTAGASDALRNWRMP
jgi:hypothetical protein